MSYISLIKSRRRGSSLPFASRAEVTTVSIHASRGRALAISPRQSTAVPTLPSGQGGRGRGESDSFPSFSLSLSSRPSVSLAPALLL